jgi:hypothetical protein
MDEAIEATCKSCQECQLHLAQPTEAPVHYWPLPEAVWSRVHVDFAGPVEGKMLLVAVDARTKWPEVRVMKTTTTELTIAELRSIFAVHGLPKEIVSDNGPQFRSTEFENFMKANGIRGITSAPYHPRTNGLAERFVKTIKEHLETNQASVPLQHKVDNFLLTYRNCPHATTGISPAMALFNRPLRCRLDLLKPELTDRMAEKQTKDQSNVRVFSASDVVLARDYTSGNKWAIGQIMQQTGPLSYLVKVKNNVWRRHVDQLRATKLPVASAKEPINVPKVIIAPGFQVKEPANIPTALVPL